MSQQQDVDLYAAERRILFASKVDELALLIVCEPEENAQAVLDMLRERLLDVLEDDAADLFIQAVVKRKTQIERGATPIRSQ
jgi:hypothetical protein